MRKAGAIVCLFTLGFPAPTRAEESGATPTYTNDDLERLAPLRGETGVLSKPASREQHPAAESSSDEKAEAYWRKEAERLRKSLRPLQRRAQELQLRIQESRADAGNKKRAAGNGSGTATSLARRLEVLEAEIREREDELLDRARRARALPGWLR